MKNNLKPACKLLLKKIVEAYEGQSEVAKIVKTDRQLVYTACSKGYFTLTTVYSVAKALNINPWALSYLKLYSVFGKERSVPFEQVVSELKDLLKPEDMKKIISIYKNK